MIYKNVLVKAIERIKGYCLKQVGCSRCRFSIDGECVLYHKIPADWELPDKKKEK